MMNFYICEVCGNLVGMIEQSGVPMQCCDQDMTELIPGSSKGAAEKHVPVCKTEGHTVIVTVGSVDHPMEASHYIEWIAIKTAKGVQRKVLAAGNKPCAKFARAYQIDMICPILSQSKKTPTSIGYAYRIPRLRSL